MPCKSLVSLRGGLPTALGLVVLARLLRPATPARARFR
jgi:hypothetical protein